MSTFATTVWLDVRPDGPVKETAAGLEALRDERSTLGAPAERIWVAVESDWVRLSTYLTFGIELVGQVVGLLGSAGEARAAVAEDNDEYGACWVVLAAAGGTVRTVHRRYILNADPRSRRQVRQALRVFTQDGVEKDPRRDDVAGPRAAADAALLFGVEPGPVAAAEAAADRAHEEIGIVGGPFPWIEPMGLVWPGPEAGRVLSA